MKFLKKAALALTTSAVAVCAVAGLANASTISGGTNVTTSTSPEYIVADENASVSYSAGHVTWSSKDSQRGPYVSTYDVTGYSRGNNAASLNGHYGRDYAYRIPAPVVGTGVTSGMTYSGSVSRPGWDLWLVPNGDTGSWTSASRMESHSQSVEIMVQPGGGGYISNPSSPYHQHRAYVGGGNLRSVNLTSVAETWLKKMRLNPSGYSWEAIDGGYESDRYGNTFTLKSYSVNVHVSASATEGYGYNAYKTVSGQGITVGAWHYVYARKSATVSVSLQGRSYATAHADAVNSAKANATAGARSKAIIAADAAAKSAAIKALTAKEPWGWTPRETGRTVISADAAFKADGFNHRHIFTVRIPRGYHAVVSGQTYKWMAKTGTVYIWERAVR